MTNVFALLRLLPVSSRDKDAEILALRHLWVPKTCAIQADASSRLWQLGPRLALGRPGLGGVR
jgi:hypothetical protein